YGLDGACAQLGLPLRHSDPRGDGASGGGRRAMKVVLFCGGLGLRMRDATSMPKPMAMLRNRPILWHLMRYYAHYGHKDFILCLGYRGDAIKEFFLKYDECMSNDFVLTD